MAADDDTPNPHPHPNIRIQVPFPYPPQEPTSQADSPASNAANTPQNGLSNSNQAQTTNETNSSNNSPTTPQPRSRESSSASTASRLRTASIKATKAALAAAPPPGMWAATGSIASRVPTVTELRGGAFGEEGWHEEGQRQVRVGRGEMVGFAQADVAASEGVSPRTSDVEATRNGSASAMRDVQLDSHTEERTLPAKEKGEVSQYANGYIPPPKIPWKRATLIALRHALKFILTPSGALITLYGLNVVAWGAMLFFLLLNVAPAMCSHGPDGCDDIDSPRRVWIEIDSQILNALFCVTGFGLAPWRFRDLAWLAWWRLARREEGVRRLAGIHRNWFRLKGSETLPPTFGPSSFLADAANALDTGTAATPTSKDVASNPAVPIPAHKIPDPPPTGLRAPPTRTWKLDFVIWMNALNTFFQIVLCYYMWHYDRVARPSWATGTFVAFGCVVAGVGGIVIYFEGRRVKKVEGVPVPKAEAGGEDLEKASVEVGQLNGEGEGEGARGGAGAGGLSGTEGMEEGKA